MTASSQEVGARPQAAAATRGAVDALSAFAVIAAMATLLHRLAVPNWITNLVFPTGWLSVITAFVLLFKPSSTRVLVVYLVASLAEAFRLMPTIPNHLLFEALAHLTMLTMIVRRWLSGRPAVVDRQLLWRELAPVLRLEVILLYAFAVLHKLNWDFLDPGVSCAVEMNDQLAQVFPFVPAGDAMAGPIIALTLLFEAGIPALLAFRRTAHLGILSGLFFHLMLSIHPHPAVFSFSAMLYSMFFAFLSPSAVAAMVETARGWLGAYRKVLPSISPKALVVFGFILVLMAMAALSAQRPWFRYLVMEITRHAFWAWVPWCLLLGLAYVVAIRRSSPPATTPWLAAPAAAWPLLALLCLNGMTPYLGLKTVSNFSMFSNLRTEENPNHLFMPQLVQSHWQSAHVVILRSNHEGTQAECAPLGGIWCSYPGERVPYFELKRWMSRMKTLEGERVSAKVELDGRRFQVSPGDGSDLAKDLYAEHGFLANKLLAFRFVQDPTQPMPCQW